MSLEMFVFLPDLVLQIFYLVSFIDFFVVTFASHLCFFFFFPNSVVFLNIKTEDHRETLDLFKNKY